MHYLVYPSSSKPAMPKFVSRSFFPHKTNDSLVTQYHRLAPLVRYLVLAPRPTHSTAIKQRNLWSPFSLSRQYSRQMSMFFSCFFSHPPMGVDIDGYIPGDNICSIVYCVNSFSVRTILRDSRYQSPLVTKK